MAKIIVNFRGKSYQLAMTEHARERMIRRNISLEELIEED